MRAVVLTSYGEVDKLEVRELPDPKPGTGELKVKVAAAGINPIDWKLRSGAMKAWMPLTLPAVLGRDISGIVLEAGAGVTGFRAGDKVLGFVQGGYAEQVVAAQESFAIAPEGLDLVEAAALPLVMLTGAQLIEEAVRPRSGDRVLVTGAVGSVGRVAVFAAKRLGARVIAGVRGRQKGEAQQLGAVEVVAIDDDAEIGGLAELDAVADTVGGEAIARLLARIRKGGTIGSVVGEPQGARDRDLQVRAIVAHPDGKRLRALAEAVVRGELAIPIAKKFPLAQARDAQRFAERGGVGKVLLVP